MRLFFREGKIISTRDRRRGSGDPLMDYLARYGIVSREEIARLTEISARSKLDLTDVIVSEQVLSEDETREALPEPYPGGSLRGSGLGAVQLQIHRGFGCGLRRKAARRGRRRGLLMESMRRIDEFPLILKEFPDGAISIKRRSDVHGAKDLSSARKRARSSLDGKDDRRDHPPGEDPRFDTYEALKQLKEKNLIEVSQPDRTAVREEVPVERKLSRGRSGRNPLPVLAAGLVFFACALGVPATSFPSSTEPPARSPPQRRRPDRRVIGTGSKRKSGGASKCTARHTRLPGRSLASRQRRRRGGIAFAPRERMVVPILFDTRS